MDNEKRRAIIDKITHYGGPHRKLLDELCSVGKCGKYSVSCSMCKKNSPKTFKLCKILTKKELKKK